MPLSMDELGASGLGDHLRVGPQYYPAANRGVPIIQRGPHGMMLSHLVNPYNTGNPDPSLQFVFPNNLRARFQPGLNLPQQEVVGVMGMGAGAPEMSDSSKAEFSTNAAGLQRLSVVSDIDDHQLRSILLDATNLLTALNSHQPFEESWWGSWNRSQTIRANLQAAIQNAKRRLGGEAMGRGAAQAQVDTSSVGSTYQFLSDATLDTARGIRDAAGAIADAGQNVSTGAKKIFDADLRTMAVIGIGAAAVMVFANAAGGSLFKSLFTRSKP